jgi:N-acetylglucosamine-6-sulfatase
MSWSALARPLRAASLLVLAAALATLAGCDSDDRPIPSGPNVVVVTTDDQSLHSFRRSVMPRTFELLVDQGTDFRTAVAAPPLCCPSRAGFLTGQYPHNHGVFANRPGYSTLIDPDDVLPVWFQEAGYRTGFVGKYLNGTVGVLGGEAAPGWDSWFEVEDLSYRDARAFDDGEPVELGDEYTPAALNERAVEFVEEEAGERPFLLWLAQTPPHFRNDDEEGGTCPGKAPQPLPEDLRAMRDEPFPRYPSFDEAEISDKPPQVRAAPPLDPAEERALKLSYRCAAATLREVDRGVAAVWEALEREGEASDTVLLFNSDNGFFFGEHRIRPPSKGEVYEQALRVPMAMRVPRPVLGGRQARAVRDLVTNQDIAPTLLELAGLEQCGDGSGCRTADGRSLGTLLRGERPRWARERGILVEQAPVGCRYAAIRTRNWLYNEVLKPGPGDECVVVDTELYDLRNDPDELENVAAVSDRVERLAERLAALRGCSGTTGPDACE